MVREHQISISLKPQQFELLQRLARERGYKSVSAYVREKINELALSIDDGVLQESPAGAKLEPELISDLVRIHQELKSFFDASGSAVANASPLTERLAGGTADDFDMVDGLGADSAADMLDDFSRAEDAFASYSETYEVDESAPQAIPRSNLGGFGYGLGNYSSFLGSGNYGGLRSFDNGSDRLSGYREILDDLEELADRAFAISPRLGSMDESGESSVEATALPLPPEAPLPTPQVVPPFTPLNLEPEAPAKPERKAEAKQESQAEAKQESKQEAKPGPEQVIRKPEPMPFQMTDPMPAKLSLPIPPPGLMPTPEPEPIPAVNYPVEDESEIEEVPVTDADSSPEPALEPAPEPSIEDELLSDLLDGNLLAESRAPRENNPFAVGFAFEVTMGDVPPEAALDEVLDEVSEQADETEQVLAPAPAPTPTPTPTLVQTPISEAEQKSEPVITPIPARTAPVAPPSTSIDPAAGPDEDESGVILPGVNTNETGSKSPQSENGSQEAPGDANSIGLSGLSGGPPPKRRRT